MVQGLYGHATHFGTHDSAGSGGGHARDQRLSHDQLQFDAEWHAELDAIVGTVLVGQFIAVEPQSRLRRQLRAAITLGQFRLSIVIFLPVTIVRWRGATRIAVPSAGQSGFEQWLTVEQWFQPGRVRPAAAAAT
jgi:hypothetical protein